MEGETDCVFGDKAFVALFASIAVDLGFVFLTIIRHAPARGPHAERAAQGVGQPTPPRQASILEKERG